MSRYIAHVHNYFRKRDSWSLTLREENELRVLEKRVLNKTFWSKRDEVKENCTMRKFSVCQKYYYCNQIQEEEMGGMCSMHGKKKRSCRVVGTQYKADK